MKRPILSQVFKVILCLIYAGLSRAQSSCSCDPLPADQGTLFNVSNVSQLISAIQTANSSNGNATIVLASGTYALNGNLPFISASTTRLTIRGATGDRDDVIIKGKGWNNSDVTHIFNVAADYFTVADMTIGEVFYHPIQVHSNPDDADDFLAHNVRFIDAKEQLLKVSAGGPLFADRGTVECCSFEFTAGIAFQYYTGGIDAHHAKDWIVRQNAFRGIRSPDNNLSEHAIHFWRESSGTLVEGNHIIDCDRGIGFGLGNDALSGHQGGLIKNNFVHTSRDVGIGLEFAPGTRVYNNTVITANYSNAIEYRFAGTSNVHIANNLTQGIITDRGSGSSGMVESNSLVTSLDIFVDADNYDYHLRAVTSNITDAGVSLSDVTNDFDCQDRPQASAFDIGADEFYDFSTLDIFLDHSGISLFPNPVENVFIISGLVANYSVQVLDAMGQLYQSYDQNSGTIEIDISSLPAGLYFVKIENKSSQVVSLQLILKV